MKKLLTIIAILFMFIAPIGCNILSNAESYQLNIGEDAIVISSKCDLYVSSDFSEKVKDVDGNNIYLKHGDVVNILDLVGDFALIQTEKFKDEAYVYKYYLTQNDSQIVYPVFNGQLRKNATLYDVELNSTEIILQKNTRVFIYEGFNNKKEYTAIQVILKDGTLYMGYVKTESVNPDGVSGLLIAGISIIAAGVTIILSLVFIKKTKDKRKKSKPKIISDQKI